MTAQPAPETVPATTPPPDRSVLGAAWSLRRRLLPLAGLGVALAFLLYYPVGAWQAEIIDDDPGFTAGDVQPGQSQAVAVAAALMLREIDGHGWTPNKPFFMPASILDDMPNFQMGIAAGVARFALEMDEVIGRAPGSAGADVDLDRAAGLMQYPATVWMIDPSVPWATTLSTEKQYRAAARSLLAYNQRLAAGQADFLRRPETLAAVLDRFAKEMDTSGALLEVSMADTGWFNWLSDDVYYAGKGRAYAMRLILRGLGADYAGVLAERNLTDRWQAMLVSLSGAATPRPWVVLNGGAAAALVPNHLAMQGFYLLRARAQMAALAEALH